MFDLRTLRLAIGDAIRVEVPVTLDRLQLGGQRYEPVPARVPAGLTITRLTSGTLFDIHFTAAVFGPCQRCLEEARLGLDVEAREYQAVTPEPKAVDDETTPYLDGEQLDVDRWARDVLLLALPLKILCRDDCAGLCPTCGADLNDGACGCPEQLPDDRWAQLRDLL